MDLLLYALSPIILLVIILIIFRKPLYIAAPITFIYTLLISMLVWGVKEKFLSAAIMKALFVTIDIILIVFGAIFFLEYLKSTGLIKKIEEKIAHISDDKRVQAIIIIWFFGSFIEGTAGFGTPAAITAPLLVAIGFPIILSVIIALIGNTTAVVFGAVGTPINIGFSGLETSFVPQTAASINLIAGLIVPFLIVGYMTFYQKKPLKYFYEIIPFGLWSGICFLIPYFLLSFIGPEFPSLLGPIIGLVIVIYTTKKKLFVPNKKAVHVKRAPLKKTLKNFSPYLVLVFLLLIGSFLLPSKTIFLEEGVSHTFSLSNPGIIFLITIFLSNLFLKFDNKKISKAFNKTIHVLFHPFIAILFVTGIVQLLILSSNNELGIQSMLGTISSSLINNNFLLISPLLGVFGSFLSGSATVSNLLFGALQAEAAAATGISIVLILALQVVGAGIGNMISLTNIVAAQATVKTKGQDLKILKGTIIPAIIYLIIVTLIGILISMLNII